MQWIPLHMTLPWHSVKPQLSWGSCSKLCLHDLVGPPKLGHPAHSDHETTLPIVIISTHVKDNGRLGFTTGTVLFINVHSTYGTCTCNEGYKCWNSQPWSILTVVLLLPAAWVTLTELGIKLLLPHSKIPIWQTCMPYHEICQRMQYMTLWVLKEMLELTSCFALLQGVDGSFEIQGEKLACNATIYRWGGSPLLQLVVD